MAVEDSPRPYAHPVHTPAGVVLTAERPEDHPWHRGFSLALAAVGEHNFWGGPTYRRGEGYVPLPVNGSQQHVRFEPAEGGVIEHLEWRTQRDQLLLAERRHLRWTEGEGCWLLAVTSRLENRAPEPLAVGSPTTKGRDNAGYGGWFWRADPAFSAATVLTPSGRGGDATRGDRGRWLALVGDESRPASVLLLDADPDVEWFVRTEEYPGFGPAPFFSRERTVPPGGAFTLSTVAALADGRVDLAAAARLAERARVFLTSAAADTTATAATTATLENGTPA